REASRRGLCDRGGRCNGRLCGGSLGLSGRRFNLGFRHFVGTFAAWFNPDTMPAAMWVFRKVRFGNVLSPKPLSNQRVTFLQAGDEFPAIAEFRLLDIQEYHN